MESLFQNHKNIWKKKGEAKLCAIAAAKVNGLTLFDIAACHCDPLNDCACPRDLKVPVLEKEFLLDQSVKKNVYRFCGQHYYSRLANRTDRDSKR